MRALPVLLASCWTATVPDVVAPVSTAPRIAANGLSVDGLPAVAADGRTILAAIRRVDPADYGQLEIHTISRDDTPGQPFLALAADQLGAPVDEAKVDRQRARADRWLAVQHVTLVLHPMTVLASDGDRRRTAGAVAIEWGVAGVRVLDGSRVLHHRPTSRWGGQGEDSTDCTSTAIVGSAAIDLERRIAAIQIDHRSGTLPACEGMLATWHVISW